MKQLIFILSMSITLFACNQPANNMRLLQYRIDSLQDKLSETYKPGFGEFMSQIQVHHAKLWYAGQNNNWKLAAFEIKEIKESLTGIQQYCTDRSETKSIGMIGIPMDSLSKAINQKKPLLFKNSFVFLTATCNNCHKETNHEFNLVKIPDHPPFGNQVFEVENAR